RLANDFDFETSLTLSDAMLVRKTLVAEHVLMTCEKALEAAGGAGFYRKASSSGCCATRTARNSTRCPPSGSTASPAASPWGSTRSATRRDGAWSAGSAVIAHEIIDDGLGVGGLDRRAERLDHLVDFRLPHLLRHERRVGADVFEAVAGGALAFDQRATGCILERRLLLFGASLHGERDRDGGNSNHRVSQHGALLHATTRLSGRITLLW